MPPDQIRHLSSAEAAKALGVSTRTLRLYEQRGLVRPARTSAGWRTYDAAALTRLHQVLALKRLGLGLAAIGQALAGRFTTLEAVLAVQERALTARKAETEHALALVRRALHELAAGRNLSVDDLTRLTKETTMPQGMDEKEMKAVFEPLISKHYDAETLKTLAAKPYDQAAVTKAWDEVIADAKAAFTVGDPATPKALDVARRWNDLVGQFTGGDPKAAEGAKAVWKDAFADPNAAARLPFGLELADFVRRAGEALKAAG